MLFFLGCAGLNGGFQKPCKSVTVGDPVESFEQLTVEIDPPTRPSFWSSLLAARRLRRGQLEEIMQGILVKHRQGGLAASQTGHGEPAVSDFRTSPLVQFKGHYGFRHV